MLADSLLPGKRQAPLPALPPSLLAAGRGICRVRSAPAMRLSTNYASCTSVALDPIEKKPLYHFYPGGPSFRRHLGCNLACPFVKTVHSQGKSRRIISPEKLADLARGSIGVAYTYSEPTVWYEYVKDAAQAVKERGLVNVLVTNGMISQEPLAELLPLIDACNIDIKAMDHDFYRRTVKGDLQTVLEAAKAAKGQCHLEITNLIIPGLNDAEGQIRALIDWVAENLGRDTPLHFSRYFPAYQWDAPPTSPDTMIKALEFGRARLDYVYLGNFLILAEAYLLSGMSAESAQSELGKGEELLKGGGPSAAGKCSWWERSKASLKGWLHGYADT